MDRRALLAASAASGGDGSDWAIELHLKPEWEASVLLVESCLIEDDFSEIFEKLYNNLIALGYDEGYYITLSDIPEECNFTIDGERLSYISMAHNLNTVLEIVFGGWYCSGTMSARAISLDRDL